MHVCLEVQVCLGGKVRPVRGKSARVNGLWPLEKFSNPRSCVDFSVLG